MKRVKAMKMKTPNRISKKEKRMLSKMKMGRKQTIAKKFK
jgi:hypothetical protein